MEQEGDHELIALLIDSLGIHHDLEPYFVDAVLLKLSRGQGARGGRQPSPNGCLDLHLEGTTKSLHHMHATICLIHPDFEGFEGTAVGQHRKFLVDVVLKIC